MPEFKIKFIGITSEFFHFWSSATHNSRLKIIHLPAVMVAGKLAVDCNFARYRPKGAFAQLAFK